MNPATTPASSTWNARRVIFATLVVCAVVLAFWLLYRYYVVPFIVFIGIVLGTVIRPPVQWLGRRRLPPALGVVLVYLVLVAILGGAIRLAVPLLAEQVSTIAGKTPEYYESLRTSLSSSRSLPIRRLAGELPAALPFSLEAPAGGGSTPASALPGSAAASQGGEPASAAGDSALNGLGQLVGYLGLLGQAIFIATSILVLSFYWTLDGERSVRSLLLRVPTGSRENLRDLISGMETMVSAYVAGQAIVCISVGLMAMIAYAIIGLPYVLVLGLLAAVFEALPVIGPIIGAAPAGILALTLAPDKLIWVVVAVIVIQQAESNLIVPRVMDRSVGVNPIVTILSIAAFFGLFGLPGAVLAIPLAAIIQTLLNHFVLSPEASEFEQHAGRDRVSILRYQAQELVQDVRKQVRHKEDQVEKASDDLEDMIEAIAADLDSVLAQARPEQEGTL